MTNIDEYYKRECEKIDANDVNAYAEIRLDDKEPTNLTLETSWGESTVDLTPAIKAGETLTSLELSPAEAPVALQFNAERGEPNCINGDDLSRIISMTKLKDVDQETAPKNGDVYMYQDGKFIPFNLTDALKDLQDQIDAIGGTIGKPEGIPSNARLVWGNINIISDYTNTDNKDWGLYTHNTNVNIPNDEYFA